MRVFTVQYAAFIKSISIIGCKYSFIIYSTVRTKEIEESIILLLNQATIRVLAANHKIVHVGAIVSSAFSAMPPENRRT